MRIPLVVERTGQNSFGSGEYWSEFLWQLVELVRFFLVVDVIDQNSFGCGRDWSEFLW